MSLTALTSDRWSGLPLFSCQPDAPLQRDVHFPSLLLVFWHGDGPSIDLRCASRRWSFRPKRGHFDLYPAGTLDAIYVGNGHCPSTVIAMPEQWSHGHRPLENLTRTSFGPRIQFRDRRLERMVKSLCAHWFSKELYGSIYTECLSSAIVSRLAECSTTCASPSLDAKVLSSVVRRSLESLFEERLDSLPDVAGMADIAGVGKSFFLLSFRATYGVPLHQYLLQLRIERAQRMLGSHPKSISSLALELGFGSHAHFTSTFRARTGMTPSQFRSQRLSFPGGAARGMPSKSSDLEAAQ